MQGWSGTRVVGIIVILGWLAVPAAFAQITTGTLAGTVQDAQGGVIPGATVVVVSESRGTRGVPGVTGATGDFVVPNLAPDTYTVEVTRAGFRAVQQRGVAVGGGDRVILPTLVMALAGASDAIEVTAGMLRLQAQSGERSFTVSSAQVDGLPIGGGRNFTDLTRIVPGVIPGAAGTGGARLGGASQNNIMMDGTPLMDTGSNSQMLAMNIESVAAVTVLTSGYQAEYGRSSGLQITAVTKSGTNRFAGSLYDIEDNSDWNTNAWHHTENGVAKPVSRQRTWGYSVGGPVGRPGGDNRLFFFYGHEYRPTSSGGTVDRFRLPTALERRGDFSQSLDNLGRPIPAIRNPLTGQPYPGNVIPARDLYAPGLAILDIYPMPTGPQVAPNGYNYESVRPLDRNLLQQPVVRLDYQFSPALRVTARYSGQRERQRIVPGTMPGVNDALVPWPYISNYGVTVNYALGATTFLEGTYGTVASAVAGGGLLAGPTAGSLPALPLIYPDAGIVDPRSYQYEALQRAAAQGAASFFDGTRVNLPPNLVWGGLVANPPTNFSYPAWLNTHRVQDVAMALTKVAGGHTLKVGIYNNHSFRAQNVGAAGGASFQGTISFANDTNNPFDTGFGFANAATGVFAIYAQASKLVEGAMVYDNTEVYAQDTWKVNRRLTLEYGVRFTRQQPQHDRFGQMSNFFPDLWTEAAAPLLYVPGCSGGVTICPGGSGRVAVHPITGVSMGERSAAAIGTVVRDSGDLLNGIRRAGDGISSYGYVWPSVIYAPRVGMAYDVTGAQRVVVRASGGLFYDRPDGNTVVSVPGNPPMAESQTLTSGRLQTLGSGPSMVGASNLIVFQYDAKVPSSVQWHAGVQMALPGASMLDVSYVGQYGYNKLSAFQGGSQINLNQVDLGTAYRPAFQDPTLGTSAVPGATAYPATLLRPYRGFGTIGQQATAFSDRYHAVQASLARRFRGGLSFGINYTWSLQLQGTTGLTWRLEHGPDGRFGIREDQAQYEALNRRLASLPHVLRADLVWAVPGVAAGSGVRRVLGAVFNDWRIGALAGLSSGANYDLAFDYRSGGQPVNLTGSPDYLNNGTGARVVFLGDAGSGCSSNRYRQFDTAAVTGPDYGSVGLESGRNMMRGCPQRELDLSLARHVRLGGGRTLQVRLDAFNVLGLVNYTGRQATVQLSDPIGKTVLNAQYSDGVLEELRRRPLAAGFGAVTTAQSQGPGNNYLRVIRLTARFAF